MPLSLQEAQALQSGDQLTFGTDSTYEVVSVQALGSGVYIVFRRDDGYMTFAREYDLDKAAKIEPAPPSVSAPKEAVAGKPPKAKPTARKRSARS